MKKYNNKDIVVKVRETLKVLFNSELNKIYKLFNILITTNNIHTLNKYNV